MIYLSWNCQGFGNPRTIQTLSWLIKEKCPHLIFLIETMCNKMCMENVRRSINFENCFVVDSIGKSEGLAML